MEKIFAKIITCFLKSYLYRIIFGYDVFISYARRDGLDYSYKISQKLLAKGYECYIDQLSSITPGKELPKSIQNAILISKALVIIGSENAGKSDPVEQEIDLFLKKNRNNPIIPISFENSIFRAQWYKKIEGLPIVDELLINLKHGSPSDVVIEKIENALVFTKKSKKLRRISFFIIGLTIILSGLSVWLSNRVITVRENLTNTESQLEVSESRLKKSNGDLKVSENKLIDAEKQVNRSEESLRQTNDRLKISTQNLKSAQNQLASSQKELEEKQKLLTQVNKQVEDQKYELEFLNTIKLFRTGKIQLEDENIAEAINSFDESIREFRRLEKNPIIAQHARMAGDFKQLDITSIMEVEYGAVYSMKVSENGKQIFISYDHQDSGGNIDEEMIPEALAFSVFDLETKELLNTATISSEIGGGIYGRFGEIVAFEESGHLIFDITMTTNNSDVFIRYSLIDGSTDTLSSQEIAKYNSDKTTKGRFGTINSIKFFSEDSDLFNELMSNGRLPRMVEEVVITSPDGRTTIAGTFMGEIILVDNTSDTYSEIIDSKPVFAADFSPDYRLAYVADSTDLWKINISEWRDLKEFNIPDYQFTDTTRESMLDLQISPDGSLIAIATSKRIFLYHPDSNRWSSWILPNKYFEIAAFTFDLNRKTIDLITGKGIIYSVNYDNLSAQLVTNTTYESNCEKVAFINKKEAYALLACKEIQSNKIEILKIDLLSQATVEKYEVNLSYVSEIRSLIEIENQMILFAGDTESYRDNVPIGNEMVLFIPFPGLEPVDGFTLFSADYMDTGEGMAYSINTVEEAYPTNNSNDILAKLYSEFMLLSEGLSNKTIFPASIAAEKFTFGENDEYLISLNTPYDSDLININIKHLERELDFTYSVPWPYERMPQFGAIGPNGQKIVVANMLGEIVYFDVSDF